MKVITFYSYKGGVGRTMCLANIAVVLAQQGYKVLMVDWDMEAPGLERYFISENFNGNDNSKDWGLDLEVIKEKPGLIDLLSMQQKIRWEDAVIDINIPASKEPLHLISAGRRDEMYFKWVQNFNVDHFYAKKKGGKYIEDLRNAWRKAYDFVLIDSRTGITEVNGICTIQMPDLVVLLFTATNQGFEGVLDIARRASLARNDLPYDRLKLLFLPILSRVESAERELTDYWVGQFAEKLMDIYQYWLPTLKGGIKPAEFLMMTKIPHVPYYTFGEKLAVIKDGTSDPASMGYAYENVASLIANKLERVEELVKKRELYVGGRPQTQINLKEEVINRISDGNIDLALESLDRYLKANDFKQALNEIIILKATYKNLQVDLSLNKVSREQFNKELNEIMRKVLTIVDSLDNPFANTQRLFYKSLSPQTKKS